MAPNSQKRKRTEPTSLDENNDASNRPSPHRPQNLSHAQQNPYNTQSVRGGKRDNHQTRARGNTSASPMPSPSTTQPAPQQASTTNPPNAMSLPPLQSPSSGTQSLTKPGASAVAQSESAATPRVPAPAPPKPKPLPYHYEHLTEDCRKEWSTSGRACIVQKAQQAKDKQDPVALGIIFQELVRAGLDGLLDPTHAGQAIQEIVGDTSSTSNKTAIAFLDIFSIMTEHDVRQPNLRTLASATGISPELMRMTLDSSLLIALNLVRGSFQSQQVRTQTGVYYKQGNYNLLREESEGYAKLMNEYFETSFSARPTFDLARETFTKVLGMIGAFDLDVGRVLDVTLDVFATLLIKHYRFFVKLLTSSSWWPQNKSFEGIQVPEYPYKNLPLWALPDYPSYQTSQADKVKLEAERSERDVKFWNRAREVGISAYFELGGREIVMDEESASELQASIEKDIKDFEENQKRISEEAAARGKKVPIKETPRNFSREWLAGTRTIPPRGNFEAAQLLGFKLRFYSSAARDPEDALPENLIALASLLIKIGFISLKDLYPHLHPSDSEMDAVKQRKLQEKADRSKRNGYIGPENALTRTEKLTEETDDKDKSTHASRVRDEETRSTQKSSRAASPSKPLEENKNSSKTAEEAKNSSKPAEGAKTPSKPAEETEPPKLSEPSDQKVLLLRNLLTIGALPESLYVLGKFPWLVNAYPDLLSYIHRILHHSLSKMYEAVEPVIKRSSVRASQAIVEEPTGVLVGELTTTEMKPRSTLKWTKPDLHDVGDQDMCFYYEHWTDDIPVCQTAEDVFTLCSTFLNLSGYKIAQDTALMVKLVRIGRKSLKDDPSPRNQAGWADLVKRSLLPVLTFVGPNAGIIHEVWDIVHDLPYAIRYNMYAEWFTGATSRHPEIQEVFSRVKTEVGNIMKKTVHSNKDKQAKLLAMVAINCPGVLLQVAYSRIESYEVMIGWFVVCGKYFTDLAFDILTWSLLNGIGNGARRLIQADGMLTTVWLKSLSMFCGQAYRAYPKMDIAPILAYLGHQLRRGQATELEILEQVVWSAAGIAPGLILKDRDVIALAGGPYLRGQILIPLGDERHDRNRRESSTRLITFLKSSGLAGQLLVAIVQLGQIYPFQASSKDTPLKAICANLDKISRVREQYLQMLRVLLPVAEFDKNIPSIISLISEFGLEPKFAFEIGRASLSAKIAETDAAIKLERQQEKVRRENAEKEKLDADGDVEMGEDAPQAVPSSSSGVVASSPDKVEDGKEEGEEGDDDISMKDAPEPNNPSQSLESGVTANGVKIPWHPALQPLIQELQPLVRTGPEGSSILGFFVTFWQLASYDLLVPSAIYSEVTKRVRDRVPDIRADRKDVSVNGVREKEAKVKELNDLQDQLREEMKLHVEAYQQTRNRLSREKDHWFAGLGNTRQSLDALNTALLQDCFFPRMIMSPMDAQYTYKMLFYLHSSGTPGFRTMFFLDSLFAEKQLTSLIFQSTVNEAENFGRFLNELLKELNKWRADKTYYEKQAFGPKKDLPGFAIKITAEKGIETFREYEDFRRALFKWHRNLHLALKACFDSGEYMRIKNGIYLLMAIHQEFPVVNFMGRAQQETLLGLTNDKREELALAAGALAGSLGKREKAWIIPQAFHINETSGSGQRSSSQASPAKPAPPQPEGEQETGGADSLEVAADDSKPKPSLLNGTTHKTSTPGKGDAEDGEIEDEKIARASPNDTSNLNENDKTDPSGNEPISNTHTVHERKPTPRPSTPVPSTEQKQTIKPDPEKAQPDESQKPATPAQPNVDAPSRPAPVSSTPARTPHQLPNRPEQPPRRGTDRSFERSRDQQGGRRDGRSSQREDYGRLDRPADLSRSDSNEAARREPSPGRRSRGRTPDRLSNASYERNDRLPEKRDRQGDHGPRPLPRESRASENRQLGRVPSGYENGRERPSDHSRDFAPPPEKRQRMTPSSSMGPPGPVSQQSENRGLSHQERSAQIQQSQPPSRSSSNPPHDNSRPADDRMGMNPARAALLTADVRQDSRSRENLRERPVRHGEKDRRSSYDVDDYHHDRQGLEGQPPGLPPNNRERREEAGPPPSGPRGGRRSERDLFEGGMPPRPSNDQSVGRLAQDYPPSRPSQDPNYGRLNPQPDVPSGPRGRNVQVAGRGGRNFTAPQPPINTRLSTNEPTIPSPASESPSQTRNQASRSYRDRNAPQFERPPPTTPGSATQTPTNSQGASSDLSGVHPSRLGQVQPSPIRTDAPPFPRQPQHSPASTPGMPPPSGPRMQQANPAQTQYANTEGSRNVPTGPSNTSSNANERQRNEARKFAGMQDVLSQAGSPATATATANAPGTPANSASTPTPTAPTDRAGNVSIRGQATSGRPRSGPGAGAATGAPTQMSNPVSGTAASGAAAGIAGADLLPPRSAAPSADPLGPGQSQSQSQGQGQGQGQRGESFASRPHDERDGGRRAGGDVRRDERAPLGRERQGQGLGQVQGQRGPGGAGGRESGQDRYRLGEQDRSRAGGRGDERGDRERERDVRDLRDRKEPPHRPAFERGGSDRDIRDAGAGRRGRDDGRDRVGPPGGGMGGAMSRGMDGGGRRSMPSEMEHGYGGGWGSGHADGRNGDGRMRGPPAGHMGPPGGAGGDRRDERDRGGRDNRKRRADEGMHGDNNKRSRRSG
ncbi:MAG: hypothetical protein Q9165_004110 [Trypethelium subeluteriae]